MPCYQGIKATNKQLAGSIPVVNEKQNCLIQSSKEVFMANLQLAVRVSRKWVMGISFSLTLGTGMTTIQPNGVFSDLMKFGEAWTFTNLLREQ